MANGLEGETKSRGPVRRQLHTLRERDKEEKRRAGDAAEWRETDDRVVWMRSLSSVSHISGPWNLPSTHTAREGVNLAPHGEGACPEFTEAMGVRAGMDLRSEPLAPRNPAENTDSGRRATLQGTHSDTKP